MIVNAKPLSPEILDDLVAQNPRTGGGFQYNPAPSALKPFRIARYVSKSTQCRYHSAR